LAALLSLTALGQSKEIRIAHVYDKTGPLEAYAKPRRPAQISALADRIIVLTQGSLVANGAPAQVMALAVVQQAYLGIAPEATE
jgi:ABC-type antimicrobial peptide transport system ATPase subunit